MAGSPRVGVLGLQGDVREHLRTLDRLAVDGCVVRRPNEVAELDGLIIPGGESTVIDKLSRLFGLAAPISEAIENGLPVFGTCAGLIMLASKIEDGVDGQQTFGGLDVTVRRNAFGSQLDSFETSLPVPALGADPVHAVFIRAPIVSHVGPNAEVLASLDDERVVAVRTGDVFGLSFHPEMGDELRFHELFVAAVRDRTG
ncbi:pyridoxal 5'-phosphate synthase glutaminase subunit PdxT [Paramicrobacterium sp. CJ85]|uniref:pyridoxal 5'-phosphate synthase glutaminase subunit PdxT n=1 Tax=Paramicrobacterium sp. CJ85 TaxID=3445355 RepID=UPI003F5F87A8